MGRPCQGGADNTKQTHLLTWSTDSITVVDGRATITSSKSTSIGHEDSLEREEFRWEGGGDGKKTEIESDYR